MVKNFPKWKYWLLIIVCLGSILYALPNIYGEDPVVQITGLNGKEVNQELLAVISNKLATEHINYKSIALIKKTAIIRFYNTEIQFKAKDFLRVLLGENYSVALNLWSVTPKWLLALGATPMKLGLDLRGGVRFVMEVDVGANVQRHIEADFMEIRSGLRAENIRYLSFVLQANQNLHASFATAEARDKAHSYINKHYPQFDFMLSEANNEYLLAMQFTARQLGEIKNYTIEQTMTTLRNRINELGVAEAVVQQQGLTRVVIELPGIQDTARAKDILGKTATLDFVMVDHDNDVNKAIKGQVPPGSRVLYERHGQPVLVKKRVILTGDSITGADSGFDSRDNKPTVSVRLGGGGIGLFKKTTMESIGKAMAVVYRESKMVEKVINGEIKKEKVTLEHIISVATIQAALGTNFQITGLKMEEARNLALLLRAGALPATISIVEEQIIGPSMGRDNIIKGIISGLVGLALVLVFMGCYYSIFGVIANLALLLNLVLLVAMMSLIGATLTLPGIAGIVLTLGMAVDANVLIFERIREELRAGISAKASINLGFEHAFATIVDANLTTLIVGIILFAIGSGPVKGFAITLSIGILTSMFTAITGTRAVINILYRNKIITKVPVGI